MDLETLERVREVVAAIPAGCVLAYGDVAARAGEPGRARLVGRILAEDGHDLPWHRVIRADGSPAPHLAAEQLSRLRAEGVLAGNGRVPMRRYLATRADSEHEDCRRVPPTGNEQGRDRQN
ncbi:MAG TPA: MGMT family protein [Pseudonocardiaceae bacterium]|jgi:methylated-DNA-protein-cysteine methyltransferase-like protein|nr:MGMT family protein [Pseudonocardiaceae bacterium]